jgi:DNA polymerase-3 subunit gamma/tau
VLLRMLAFAPAPEAAGANRGAAPAPGPTPSQPAAAAAAVVRQPDPAPAAASPPARPAARGAVADPAGGLSGAAGQRPAATLPPAGARPAADGRRVAAGEPPPWVDEPPPEDMVAPAAPPTSASLRAPGAPALAVPAPPPEPEPPVRTVLGDRWQTLVGRLAEAGAIAALVRELAWQAGLEGVDDTAAPPCWQLRVERDSLRTDTLRDKLAAALQAELGHALQLQLLPGAPTDSPARRDAYERARRQREAESVIRGDPLVLDLMAQFKTARIVPGSIKPI